MKKFILYLLRWQLSTPILAIVLYYLPFTTLTNTIIANLIGGIIFFWVDRLIFNKEIPKIKHKGKIIIHCKDEKKKYIKLSKLKDFELKEGDAIYKDEKDGKWHLERRNKC